MDFLHGKGAGGAAQIIKGFRCSAEANGEILKSENDQRQLLRRKLAKVRRQVCTRM